MFRQDVDIVQIAYPSILRVGDGMDAVQHAFKLLRQLHPLERLLQSSLVLPKRKFDFLHLAGWLPECSRGIAYDNIEGDPKTVDALAKKNRPLNRGCGIDMENVGFKIAPCEGKLHETVPSISKCPDGLGQFGGLLATALDQFERADKRCEHCCLS